MFCLVKWMLPATMQMAFLEKELRNFVYEVFYATLVGLVVGAAISSFTEYYTGLGKKPILKIVQQSSTGAGTNIIAGLATGMISTFSSVLLICWRHLGIICFCRFLWCCFGSFCNDGNDSHAVSY